MLQEDSEVWSTYFNAKDALLRDEATGRCYPVKMIEPSPCMRACPAGVNVKAYVSLIAAGKFQEALKVVKERNPFPGICGRVCTHPCESYCNRAEVDEPVAIRYLKRFASDYELQHPIELTPPISKKKNKKVAIVGSGPAGLTAAHDLALIGYDVTVFEAAAKPGGMLTAGIPSFRLPRNIISHEIDAIKALGVNIKTSAKISGKNAIDDLFRIGFDSVFIAVGAHKGKKMDIPGEDITGVVDSIQFLRAVNQGDHEKPGNMIAVIGGGNAAIDSARTAVRLGCEQVTIFYRRSREEMPAHEEEIRAAELEGIGINYLTTPTEFIGDAQGVNTMRCIRMQLGEPDSSGRRRPVPVPGSEYDVSVDCVITAISQEPDLAFLSNEAALKRTKWNTIAVDNVTLQTDQAGVFAGGDAVTGPNTVIDAIAAGHVAARSIDQYLEGVPLTPESHSQPEEFEVAMDRAQQAKKPRNKMPLIPPEQRKRFEEVESGFNEALAITEAQRCLRCGPCSECIVCVPECQKAVTVLSLPDSRNDFMLRFPGKEMQIESSAAGITLDDGRFIPLNAMDCYVNTERCLGCGECVAACLYHAPRLTLKGRDIFVSNIDPVLCKNCGTCVAVCPSSAINQNYFTDAWLERMLQPVQKGNDTIVLYFCNWAHTADLIPRIHELETNCLAIKVNCTGRIEPSFVLQAFERGATGVFVVGCPRKSCHFTFGNDFAEKQFNKTKNMLNLLGFPADNFNWFWYEEDKSDKILSAIDLMKQSRDQNTENSTGSKVPLPDYLTS